jgi:hypothetical protein
MTDLASLPIGEFIQAISKPELYDPTHLGPLKDILERMTTEPGIRGLSGVATRHGKTTLIEHAIVRKLARNPRAEICFFSYGAEFAYARNRNIRRLALEAGVSLSKDFNTIKEWRTADGGGVFAMSADQDVIGRGFDWVIVDDPIGNAVDADNPEIRNQADAKIRFLTTRLHPGGSVLVNASRFHPDDPVGRRLKDSQEKGPVQWEHAEMPAILDAGQDTERALWPDRWSIEQLKQLRAELAVDDPAERTWWAQYMCDPRAESGDMFQSPGRYSQLPVAGFRLALGLDAAYSAKPTADWFALAGGMFDGSMGYLVEVERFRADEGQAVRRIRSFHDRWGVQLGTIPIFSYVAGPEVGMIANMHDAGIPVQALLARFHKVTRARRTIERWNTGRLLLPMNASWVPGVLSRFLGWRGHDGESDDEIDATVSLVDGATHSGVTPPGPGFGVRRV